MKAGDSLKRALLAFVIALVAYAVMYQVIEHRRAAKGPWQVTFSQDASGAPAILIDQPAIGVTNVQILFLGSSDALTNEVEPRGSDATFSRPITMTFNQAHKTPFEVPYGKCVFLDTIFLPGTVVFETFGHQIQLMPRVLTIDHVEHSWQGGIPFKLRLNTNSNESPK